MGFEEAKKEPTNATVRDTRPLNAFKGHSKQGTNESIGASNAKISPIPIAIHPDTIISRPIIMNIIGKNINFVVTLANHIANKFGLSKTSWF